MTDLSPAETRVLKLAATGKTYLAVAHELGVSHQTVKNQMSSVLRKVDASSAIEAFRKLDWLTTPDDICGWVGTCGRPKGHRGHHGGFREAR